MQYKIDFNNIFSDNTLLNSLKRLQTSHYYHFDLRQSKALKIHQGFCSRLNGLYLYYAVCARVRQW